VYQFLIPLLLGFTFTSASVFTTYYSRMLGERGGRLVSIILRVILGIPLWVIGYIMAAQVDVATLFKPAPVTSALAWLSIVAGVAITVAGLVTIRGRAAAPSVTDTLVQQGIYAYIRHPLYSGVMLELVGLFFLSPTFPLLVACALGVIWVMLHARLEEIDGSRLPTRNTCTECRAFSLKSADTNNKRGSHAVDGEW
jgi:protein-S-isoprenylcysteine O-methyltransferase Ste14